METPTESLFWRFNFSHVIICHGGLEFYIFSLFLLLQVIIPHLMIFLWTKSIWKKNFVSLYKNFAKKKHNNKNRLHMSKQKKLYVLNLGILIWETFIVKRNLSHTFFIFELNAFLSSPKEYSQVDMRRNRFWAYYGVSTLLKYKTFLINDKIICLINDKIIRECK